MIDLAQHRKPRKALLTPRSEDMRVVVDAQLRSRRDTLVHIRVQAAQMRAGFITPAQASKWWQRVDCAFDAQPFASAID